MNLENDFDNLFFKFIICLLYLTTRNIAKANKINNNKETHPKTIDETLLKSKALWNDSVAFVRLTSSLLIVDVDVKYCWIVCVESSSQHVFSQQS